MDAANPSPAAIRARRWLRAMYTPAAISSRHRIGSTIFRSLISRYRVCAWTRVFDVNSVSVGWIGGSLSTSENPRATRACLTIATNGARSMTTFPLLTVIAPPWPDRAWTRVWWAVLLTWVQVFANCGLVTILWT